MKTAASARQWESRSHPVTPGRLAGSVVRVRIREALALYLDDDAAANEAELVEHVVSGPESEADTSSKASLQEMPEANASNSIEFGRGSEGREKALEFIRAQQTAKEEGER